MKETCPACGGPLPEGAAKCPHCGITLIQAEERNRENVENAPLNLVPVFRGEMSQVLPLQAALEAEGIPTFIQDEHIKYLDPFLTGGYGFGITLLVPRNRAEDALRMIRNKKDRALPEPTPKKAALEDIAHRIRWAALHMVTGPLGLVLFPSYLYRVFKTGARPKGHGITLAAGGFCLFLSCIFVWYLALVMAKVLPSAESIVGMAFQAIPSFGF